MKGGLIIDGATVYWDRGGGEGVGGGGGGSQLPVSGTFVFTPGSRPVVFSIAKYYAMLRNFFIFLLVSATLRIPVPAL